MRKLDFQLYLSLKFRGDRIDFSKGIVPLKNQTLETVMTTCQQFLSYSNIFSNILWVTTAEKDSSRKITIDLYIYVIFLLNSVFLHSYIN